MRFSGILKSVFPLAAACAFAALPGNAAPPRSAAPGAAVAGANPDEVKIVSLTDLKDYEQTATTIGNRSAGKKKKWGVFDVTFATKPEWVDEISITYTVLFMRDVSSLPKGEKPMSLFQVTVVYPDISADKEHKAGVVLLPQALLRFGKCIGFAAQLYVDGKVVAEMGKASDARLNQTEKWWSNQQILSAPGIQKREGYLIDRKNSPFRLVEIDKYEESI